MSVPTCVGQGFGVNRSGGDNVILQKVRLRTFTGLLLLPAEHLQISQDYLLGCSCLPPQPSSPWPSQGYSQAKRTLKLQLYNKSQIFSHSSMYCWDYLISMILFVCVVGWRLKCKKTNIDVNPHKEHSDGVCLFGWLGCGRESASLLKP